MDSSRKIEDAAAVWLQRRDSDQWSTAEQAELDQWLEESTAHRIAYLRLEAAWEHSERLQALGAGTSPGVIPPRGEWRVSPLFDLRPGAGDWDQGTDEAASPLAFPHPPATRVPPSPVRVEGHARSARHYWLAAAASVLVVTGLGYVARQFFGGERYATPIGGMASIPLKDGSNITLNTQSKINVEITKDQRLIKLQSGEAFFDVAKDSTRPFVVEAAGKRIVAVGTRFSVRRDDGDIQVVVTDGRVRVEGSELSASSALAPPSSPEVSSRPDSRGVLLDAGAIAHTSHEKLLVATRTAREADQALSWRTGYLVFDSMPLADAIAEFNRYTEQKIFIEDAGVAALKISGKFRTTNAQAFIRVLRDGFNIRARTSDGRVLLSQG